jgi:hypothetical protein
MLYEQESYVAVLLNENVRKQIIDDLNEKDGSLYIHIDSQFDHAYNIMLQKQYFYNDFIFYFMTILY